MRNRRISGGDGDGIVGVELEVDHVVDHPRPATGAAVTTARRERRGDREHATRMVEIGRLELALRGCATSRARCAATGTTSSTGSAATTMHVGRYRGSGGSGAERREPGAGGRDRPRWRRAVRGRQRRVRSTRTIAADDKRAVALEFRRTCRNGRGDLDVSTQFAASVRPTRIARESGFAGFPTRITARGRRVPIPGTCCLTHHARARQAAIYRREALPPVSPSCSGRGRHRGSAGAMRATRLRAARRYGGWRPQ